MQIIIQKVSSSLALFLVCILITIPSLAQKKEGKESKQQNNLLPDGTIHLRIEKYKNGQKQVYEHTYKEGNLPRRPFPDSFMFNSADSVAAFRFFQNKGHDSIAIISPSGRAFFYIPDSLPAPNYYFFEHNSDGLMPHPGHMQFHFHHSSIPEIDSLLSRSLERSSLIFSDMTPNFRFHVDTLFNRGFDFNWGDEVSPLKRDNLNLLLDKDKYEVEEVEKDGKRMIHIRSRKSAPDQKAPGNNKKIRKSPR
jgi:hypothetical protein